MKKASVAGEHRSRSPIKANHNVQTFNSNQPLWNGIQMSNKNLVLPSALARRSETNLNNALSRINRQSSYNLRRRKPLETSNLQDHFPRVMSTTCPSFAKEYEKLTCACCSPPSPPCAGVTAQMATATTMLPLPSEKPEFTQNLAPICPVPMLSSSPISQINPLSYTPVSIQSVETQTSLPSPERGRKRRRSSGQLMTSIKRKFSNLRRSLSSDRLTTRIKVEPFEALPEIIRDFPMEENASVKVNFVEKCDNGAYLIQFQRNTTTQAFGLFFNLDADGFYISRLAKEQHIRVCQKYLHVNDRVLAIQGVPSKLLSAEGIRGLLQGCHLVTIKVGPVNRFK